MRDAGCREDDFKKQFAYACTVVKAYVVMHVSMVNYGCSLGARRPRCLIERPAWQGRRKRPMREAQRWRSTTRPHWKACSPEGSCHERYRSPCSGPTLTPPRRCGRLASPAHSRPEDSGANRLTSSGGARTDQEKSPECSPNNPRQRWRPSYRCSSSRAAIARGLQPRRAHPSTSRNRGWGG